MTTYFFDPSVTTNGTGSEASPFNVLPANFSSAGYVDGDILLFKRGSVYAPTWAGTDATLHTVNRRLTFGAYGEGPRPVIRPTFTGTGSGRVFRVFTGGCAFSDIDFRDGVASDPLYVQGGIAGFSVRRCGFFNLAGGLGQNGINVGASAPLTGRLEVLDSQFDTIANDAMVLNCADEIEVAFNTVNNPSAFAANGDCVSIVGDCAKAWVHHNDLRHVDNDNKHGIIFDGGTTGHALVEYNTITCANKPGVYMGLPGIVRGNFISTGRSGVYCHVAGVTVKNNLILQKAGGTDTGAVWGAEAGMVVIGNTIIRDTSTTELSDAAIRNNTNDASNVYQSNLIIGFARGVRKGANAVESHNAFWSVENPVIDASASTVSPTSALLIDPMVSDSFRPLYGSPLISTGVHTGYKTDILGNQYFNPPSIGAFEYTRPRSSRE